MRRCEAAIPEGDEALACLSAREQRVLELRYGLHGHRAHSLTEVAKMFGLTRERIRQIEKAALARLDAEKVAGS